MPNFPEFVGPSYEGRASNADQESSMNFYVERMGSQGGAIKSAAMLLSKPGLAAPPQPSGAKQGQSNLPVDQIAGIVAINGRLFVFSNNPSSNHGIGLS